MHPPNIPPTKPKTDPQTSSEKGRSYLDRLNQAKGKRVVVDLDEQGKDALEKLINAGYGLSQKEVVINALKAEAEKLPNTTHGGLEKN